MTPARKKALQWFFDRGEVTWFVMAENPPSDRMMDGMIRDGLLERRSRGNMMVMAYSLTDKGRRALNGDAT